MAKRVLSVAVYNHYKRLFFPKNDMFKDVEIQKSNILLGATGTENVVCSNVMCLTYHLQLPMQQC